MEELVDYFTELCHLLCHDCFCDCTQVWDGKYVYIKHLYAVRYLFYIALTVYSFSFCLHISVVILCILGKKLYFLHLWPDFFQRPYDRDLLMQLCIIITMIIIIAIFVVQDINYKIVYLQILCPGRWLHLSQKVVHFILQLLRIWHERLVYLLCASKCEPQFRGENKISLLSPFLGVLFSKKKCE